MKTRWSQDSQKKEKDTKKRKYCLRRASELLWNAPEGKSPIEKKNNHEARLYLENQRMRETKIRKPKRKKARKHKGSIFSEGKRCLNSKNQGNEKEVKTGDLTWVSIGALRNTHFEAKNLV